MLRAIDLGIGYAGEPLFTGLSFTLDGSPAGFDRVGLVGPNGVGKSTLLGLLVGLATPDTGHIERGPDTRVGYYAQQVPDPAITIGDYLAEAPGELATLDRDLRRLAGRLDSGDPVVLSAYGLAQERFGQLGGWAYAARVDAVRTRLGLADLPGATRLGDLSGGEQARVMLAQVLLAEPTVLVLDEPTNHLDADGTAWLGDYLAAFPGVVLVVTHDRAFLDRMATRIFELDGIHDDLQVYEGNYTAYRAEKQRRWARRLLDYEAQEKARRRLAEDIERTKDQARGVELTVHKGLGADHLRRYAKKVARKAKARERRLTRQMQATAWLARPQIRPTLALQFGPAVPDGELLIKAGSLAVHKRLSEVDISVYAGERILIGGPNGAGKSTLLAALAGELPPTQGSVASLAPIARLPQTHHHLPARSSVLDFFRSRVPMYVDQAESTLDAYQFDATMWDQPIGTLSAGELRRLLLATMVNGGASVLLLDEPTNYLDFDSLDVVEEALRAFRGTILMVTHDRYFASAVGFTARWEVRDGVLSTS